MSIDSKSDIFSKEQENYVSFEMEKNLCHLKKVTQKTGKTEVKLPENRGKKKSQQTPRTIQRFHRESCLPNYQKTGLFQKKGEGPIVISMIFL